MVHPGDKQEDFPAGYEHIGQLVRATSERLQHLEAQIEKIQAGKDGPIPRLTPAGGPPPRSRDQTIAELRRQKEQLREDVQSRVEKATYQDREKGREVRDRSLQKLYPNEFRMMTAEQLQAYRSHAKDLNRSQDFVDATLSKGADRGDKVPEPAREPDREHNTGSMQMSAKFMMTLGYPTPTEKTEPPGNVPVVEKNQPEPER